MYPSRGVKDVLETAHGEAALHLEEDLNHLPPGEKFLAEQSG
jgi:hypothetical protein